MANDKNEMAFLMAIKSTLAYTCSLSLMYIVHPQYPRDLSLPLSIIFLYFLLLRVN